MLKRFCLERSRSVSYERLPLNESSGRALEQILNAIWTTNLQVLAMEVSQDKTTNGETTKRRKEIRSDNQTLLFECGMGFDKTLEVTLKNFQFREQEV